MERICFSDIRAREGYKLVEVAHVKYCGGGLIQKELILTPLDHPRTGRRQYFVNCLMLDYEGWRRTNRSLSVASPLTSQFIPLLDLTASTTSVGESSEEEEFHHTRV